MTKIAVFASGKGSNFAAIARAIKKGRLDAELTLLVCDNPGAPVIQRAKRLKVKVALVKKENFSSREDFEKAVIRHLQENGVDLIVLAGFMRMLGTELLSNYQGRILNIHPALLPAFKGSEGIKDAFTYGAKITGVTVLFVVEKMDHGPIILQAAVKIEEKDTLESLQTKIHKLEHKLYPEAIRLFIGGKLRIEGRRVRISIP